MQIELIDENTVKVIISKSDMSDFKITYEEMDYKNVQTKKIISKAIEKIKSETALDITSSKLFVEAFPYIDGGCILYMNVIELKSQTIGTKKRYRTSFDTPIIYTFDNIDKVVNVSKRLIENYNHVILKSSLFFCKKKYYLLLYTYFKMDDKIGSALKEYGSFFGKGAIPSAIVKEHAKEIIETYAIETLTKYIS
ncbi:MAG: adaptor protein MecA [Oscillospiraceae bacterium]